MVRYGIKIGKKHIIFFHRVMYRKLWFLVIWFQTTLKPSNSFILSGTKLKMFGSTSIFGSSWDMPRLLFDTRNQNMVIFTREVINLKKNDIKKNDIKKNDMKKNDMKKNNLIDKKGNNKEEEQLAKLCPPDMYEKLADKTYIGDENPRLVYPESYDPDKPIPVTTENNKPIVNPNNYLLFRKLENNLDLTNLAQPTPKTMEMIDVIRRQIHLVERCNHTPTYDRRFSTGQEFLDFFSQWIIICGDVGIVPNIRLFCVCAGINYRTFVAWYKEGNCSLEMQKACGTIMGWLNASEETMAVAGQLDSKIYQFHSINRGDMLATKAEATIHAVSEAEITPEEIAARLPEL